MGGPPPFPSRRVEKIERWRVPLVTPFAIFALTSLDT